MWSKNCKNGKSDVTWLHRKADAKYRIQTQKRLRSQESIETRKRFKSLVQFWPDACDPEASKCARIIGLGSGRTQNTELMWITLSGYTALVSDPCANDRTSIYACFIASDVQRWCCMVDKTFKIQELTEQALGSVLYICPFICSIIAGVRLFCVCQFVGLQKA